MGAMQELGLKPGVITGDDVLHVNPASLGPIADLYVALRVRSQAPIRYSGHCKWICGGGR